MPSFIRSALVIGIALGVNGCANFAPDYQRPALPVSDNISGLENRSGRSIELPAWQGFFPDAKVRELITKALENNRDLHVAAANVAEAQGLYQIQRTDKLPTVNAQGSGNRIRNSENLTGNDNISRTYNANIGLVSYEVDFWGRVRNLTNAALASYFATLEAQRASQLNIISQTANAYYNWLAASENLRLADETLKGRNESYQLIELRKSVGIASDLDLAQAEIAKVTVEAQRAQNLRTLSSHKASLELLVGAPIKSILDSQATQSKPEFDLEIPADLSSQSTLESPGYYCCRRKSASSQCKYRSGTGSFLSEN